MAAELILRGGKICQNGELCRRSVVVDKGKIEGIYRIGQEPTAEIDIDCTGLYILPGMVDIHTHLRDLKQSKKEVYRSGTMAAAAGGVTTVVDMPNTQPPVLSLQVLERKIEQAKRNRFVNIGFYGGIPQSPDALDERFFNKIMGLKVYPHSPLHEDVRYTKERIGACLNLAKRNHLPLLFHPDLSNPSAKAKTVQDFFKIHSCEAEKRAIVAFIQALQETESRMHVCHVSCASAANLIKKHRAENILTAEVTPHHLFLTGDQFTNEDGRAKVMPPLRSPYDKNVLNQSLSRCVIDCVASDHAPHTENEKCASFLDAPSGFPGLETTVPLMLTRVFRGEMHWVEYLRCCCSGPARILNIPRKGILCKDYDADIVVVQEDQYEIRGDTFHSKANITPFEGQEVLARPVMTFVGGILVYRYGNFEVGPGTAGVVPVRRVVEH
ncbi:MAG: dihydroorotase family protein [Candidatus Thorarchaeota archaeon]